MLARTKDLEIRPVVYIRARNRTEIIPYYLNIQINE